MDFYDRVLGEPWRYKLCYSAERVWPNWACPCTRQILMVILTMYSGNAKISLIFICAVQLNFRVSWTRNLLFLNTKFAWFAFYKKQTCNTMTCCGGRHDKIFFVLFLLLFNLIISANFIARKIKESAMQPETKVISYLFFLFPFSLPSCFPIYAMQTIVYFSSQ